MEWMKEFLKDYIEDAEKLDGAVESFNRDVFPKHAIPKSKFNETSDELKTMKEQLAKQKELAENLTKKAETAEQYEQQIQEWQDKYSTLETDTQKRISEITKSSQFKEYLMKSAAHEDALDLLLEKYTGTVEIDSEGKLKDVDKVIEQMKTERPGLFKETVEDSSSKAEHREGGKEKQPSEMTDAEYAAWYQEREKARQPL